MSSESASSTWEEIRTNLRRAQILEAATRVFAEKGYHRATTKDIARAAKMAEGTIYLYFENKAELLIALIEHLDQATTQPADYASGLDMSLRALLAERLERDLSQLGSQFDQLMAILPEALADPALRPQYYQRVVAPGLAAMADHLRTRQERGEVSVEDVAMASRVFAATMLGLQILHILGDDIVRAAWRDPRQLAEQIARVLFDGIQPPGR